MTPSSTQMPIASTWRSAATERAASPRRARTVLGAAALATGAALAGGWFHSGDLGVMHPDGYLQLKDRSKDIIISGGENISSIEVEDTLYRHPAVLEAAVVARSDEKWGETPCAFVTLKDDSEETSAEDIIAFCRDNMARYKAPKTVVFGPLPKTSTGKIQKFKLRERIENLDS